MLALTSFTCLRLRDTVCVCVHAWYMWGVEVTWTRCRIGSEPICSCNFVKGSERRVWDEHGRDDDAASSRRRNYMAIFSFPCPVTECSHAARPSRTQDRSITCTRYRHWIGARWLSRSHPHLEFSTDRLASLWIDGDDLLTKCKLSELDYCSDQPSRSVIMW